MGMVAYNTRIKSSHFKIKTANIGVILTSHGILYGEHHFDSKVYLIHIHAYAPENISGHFGLLFLRAPYKFQFYLLTYLA